MFHSIFLGYEIVIAFQVFGTSTPSLPWKLFSECKGTDFLATKLNKECEKQEVKRLI